MIELRENFHPWRVLWGEISPQYTGPYTIFKRIDTVDYQLEQPHELA